MPRALYRLRLPDGNVRLARGTIKAGPLELLPSDATIGQLLRDDTALDAATRPRAGAEPVPSDARQIAPVDTQEVWAAGVTYVRSRDARMDESTSASTVYDQVYDAHRPELFLKAPGWRVRGPGDAVGIRADSIWNVPEPELTLVVAADGSIVGYTIGNDMSSRSIEGENPLYLPQAKTYDGSCAIGPAIVPAADVRLPLEIHLAIVRSGAELWSGSTSTASLHRELADLVEHLGRALTIPDGAFLLTGTGIVPPDTVTLRVGDQVRIEIEHLGVLSNEIELVGRRTSPEDPG